MSGPAARRVAPLWWVLSTLVFLVVACLVFVGWVYLDRAGEGGIGARTEALRADTVDAAQVRSDARQRATEFVEEFFTYGPDDLDDQGSLAGFKDRIRPLMSAKFRTALDQRLLQIEGIVAQYEVRSAGTVQGVGVASFDEDSAEVLVGGWGTQAYPNPEKESEEIKGDRLPFRFEVSLVRVDGEWLVDNLDSFDDQDEGLADPTEAPEPSAPGSSEPSPSVPVPSESQGDGQ
ncbi:hypothetical protein KUV85_16250 [Nocardioides panacisoli]|uniref:hypothetical protein n=1 Tax=Nocardioides panacisoli TaxID=627624 RepID=UPI001C639C2F|nr:hypothetical protein [Nocardioides panacisoli]QYJ03852.1 hypothetical protein KUV85_16250 [Nocardioides panacisoli]